MARNAHPEVTRQRILDAAKKLFAQKGYERTTIQDILDELEDLSKGAIYHHFKNKEAMLHALVDSDNERLLPQANQEDGSRNGLQKLRNSLMMQITDTEHMTLMRDAFPLLNDPKILAENLRRKSSHLANRQHQNRIRLHPGGVKGRFNHNRIPSRSRGTFFTAVQLLASPKLLPHHYPK